MPVVEAMACGVPSSRRRTRRSTRRAATPRCAPIPTDPDAIAAAIAQRARSSRRARRRRARARALVHLARERPRASRGVGVGAVKVAVDVTPLRLTRAGTARYIRNLPRSGSTCEPVAFGGADRRVGARARARGGIRSVLARLAPRDRRAALHDLLRAAAPARPDRRHGARPRGLPPSARRFRAGRAPYGRASCRASCGPRDA